MERPSGDPRAQRTRDQIFGAVQTLATERSKTLERSKTSEHSKALHSGVTNAEALNVSDIVRVAKISRSTFYAHFSDIDELAVAFLQATFAEPGAPNADLRIAGEASDKTARRGYRQLVAHIVDHYSVYQSTLTLPPMRKAYDDAVAAYARSLVLTIAEPLTFVERTKIPDGVHLETVATYAAGGAIALIREWLDGSISMSDDELVEQLVALLPRWLLPPRLLPPAD